MNTLLAKPASAVQSEWPVHMALILAVLLWSGNFIAGRWLRDAIDPLSLNTIRWAISLTLLMPFTARRLHAQRAALCREWRWLLFLAITGIAGFHVLVYQALSETTAINALLILALIPIITMIGSHWLSGFCPSAAQKTGAAIGLLGIVILVTRGDLGTLTQWRFNIGDLWMLCAVVLWVGYTLALKQRPKDLSADTTLAASIVLALALMVPLLGLFPPTLALDTGSMLAIGYIAVFASLIGFLLWSWGVDRAGTERAGQFVHLMPVFGSILAVVILGETITAIQIGGAILALSGLVLVVRAPANHGAKPQQARPHVMPGRTIL